MTLALGIGGLLLAGTGVAAGIASVHHASAGPRELLLVGLHFTYPTINTAGALLLAVGATGGMAIIVAIRACWREVRGYRALIVQVGPVKALDKDARVSVIADPLAQEFCAGYLRPKVYVSRGTVELLTDSELDAVLAHEHHHRRLRDPLRLAYSRILSEALFFVPVLTALSERYAELAEVSADRAAVRASDGEAAPLASALLAFAESGPPGVTGISPERVDSLLGEPINRRLPLRVLALSLAVLAGMSILLWLVRGTASAHATFNLPLLSAQPCVVILTIISCLCGRALARSPLRRKRLAIIESRSAE